MALERGNLDSRADLVYRQVESLRFHNLAYSGQERCGYRLHNLNGLRKYTFGQPETRIVEIRKGTVSPGEQYLGYTPGAIEYCRGIPPWGISLNIHYLDFAFLPSPSYSLAASNEGGRTELHGWPLGSRWNYLPSLPGQRHMPRLITDMDSVTVPSPFCYSPPFFILLQGGGG